MYDNEFMEQLLQGISDRRNACIRTRQRSVCQDQRMKQNLQKWNNCLREVETLACRMRQSFFEKPEWDRKFIYCHQSGKQAVCDETVYL